MIVAKSACRLWVHHPVASSSSRSRYYYFYLSSSSSSSSSLLRAIAATTSCSHHPFSSTADAPDSQQHDGRGGETFQQETKSKDFDLPRHHFYVPRAERGGNRSVFEMDYMVGETRLARNSRTCPTRELYFTHVQWHRHKSPYRKFRHMANLFRAAPFQRLLFPDLFCITTVAGCLTYYNEFVVSSAEGLLAVASMSPSAFAGATTAIGLLAGFRLNSSVGRVTEGRKAWSDVNTTTRDLTRQVLMWMTHDKIAQTRMLRLCKAFPVTLMFALNDKGCHHNMKRKSKVGEAPFKDRVQAEFRSELIDVYYPSNGDTGHDNIILHNDFQRLCRVKAQGGNAPLEVLTCMSETIAAAASAAANASDGDDDGGGNSSSSNNHKVNPIYIRELDIQVQRLCKALGSSERIVKTPLPTGFTRHSSRLLFIWSNCLPFALYPMLGPLGTLPTSLLTAYAVLGIEDISNQLEEPFDILPLRQYSDSMYDSIEAIQQSYTPYSTPAPTPAMMMMNEEATTSTTK